MLDYVLELTLQIFPSRYSHKFKMSSYSTNCVATFFPSVLSMKDEPMIEMFKMLKATDLKTFLGCTDSISEPILDELFSSTTVEHGAILCTIQGQNFNISHWIFVEVFDLPEIGVISCKELSPTNIETWRLRFSQSGTHLSSPNFLKKDLKVEYLLLVDLVSKWILAKAGDFDKVTTEKFQMMVTIFSGIQINWSEVLFKILSDMVKKNGHPRAMSFL